MNSESASAAPDASQGTMDLSLLDILHPFAQGSAAMTLRMRAGVSGRLSYPQLRVVGAPREATAGT